MQTAPGGRRTRGCARSPAVLARPDMSSSCDCHLARARRTGGRAGKPTLEAGALVRPGAVTGQPMVKQVRRDAHDRGRFSGSDGARRRKRTTRRIRHLADSSAGSTEAGRSAARVRGRDRLVGDVTRMTTGAEESRADPLMRARANGWRSLAESSPALGFGHRAEWRSMRLGARPARRREAAVGTQPRPPQPAGSIQPR